MFTRTTLPAETTNGPKTAIVFTPEHNARVMAPVSFHDVEIREHDAPAVVVRSTSRLYRRSCGPRQQCKIVPGRDLGCGRLLQTVATSKV